MILTSFILAFFESSLAMMNVIDAGICTCGKDVFEAVECVEEGRL
jgi:hypothetical protein